MRYIRNFMSVFMELIGGVFKSSIGFWTSLAVIPIWLFFGTTAVIVLFFLFISGVAAVVFKALDYIMEPDINDHASRRFRRFMHEQRKTLKKKHKRTV